MSIRFVTYNIRLGIQEGLEAIAQTISGEQPDVVALQEVGRHWAMGPAGDTTVELARALGLDHYVFVPSLTNGPAHYGHALLSRTPIIEAAFRRLPMEIDEPRTLLETTVEHDDGPFRILSTHLSYIDDRPPQGQLLVEAMTRRPDVPTVLLGDLNASDDEPFMVELLGLAADADPLARLTFPAHEPRLRLDYILAREGRLDDTVIGTNTTASDHLYVAATWSR